MPDTAVHSARGHLFQAGGPGLAALARAQLGDAAREPAAFLGRAFGLEPGEWLRRIPGRETFALGEELVVKRFRGDQWREWWHEWTRLGARRSPARRESENLAALHALGLCVPAPLAWAEDARSRWPPCFARGKSALAMQRLAHAEHLRAVLARANPAEVRAWLAPLAALVARLHRAHWFHRDLYLQHFAVLDAGARRLALLDCGRARRIEPVPPRWIEKDLAQLLHSTPANVPARARLAWFVLYARAREAGAAGGPGASGRGRRALIRAVVAKERRMRSHAPRHVDPRTARAEDPGTGRAEEPRIAHSKEQA